jgi:hypothetical protein
MKKLPLVLFLLLTISIVNAQKDYSSSFGVTRNHSLLKGDAVAFEGYAFYGNSVLFDYSQKINKHSEWMVRTGFIWKPWNSEYENLEYGIGQNSIIKPTDYNSYLTISGIYSFQPIKYLYIRGGINNMFLLVHSVGVVNSEIYDPAAENHKPNKQYILEGYAGAGVRIPVWRFLLKAGFFSEVALNHAYWNYGLEAGLYFQFKKRKKK